MRILVYGAGVLGCELAHVLLQNKKNDVTLLARGEWKERIDQKGLVIRQWAQRKTTVDRVRTIDVLAPEDFYDLVFVVLQAGQLPDVLPVLKANRSPYFVFVGNDPMQSRFWKPCSAQPTRSPLASRTTRRPPGARSGGQCAHRCGHDGGRCPRLRFPAPSASGSRPPLTAQSIS